MHTKTAHRPRLMSSTSLFPMMRGPQVAYAPDEEGGAADPVDETPEEFREQPGDREPDPDVNDQAEEEETDEAEGQGADQDEEQPQEEASASEAEPEPEPPKKDWKDRQIAKLREKEKAREAELEELRKRVAAAETLLSATPEERESGLSEQAREQIRKEEAERVRAEARYSRINESLESMYEAGKKEFGSEWETRVAETADVFGAELRKREDFLEALAELPNNAAVYNSLMVDPDHLEKVLGMPAHKMGMELARLSDKLSAPKPPPKVSKAPPPIKPLDKAGIERSLDELINDPNASMDEIERRMAAEERKRAKAH